MSNRGIKGDVEYVQNQIMYLEQYQLKIQKALKRLNGFSVKWRGPAENEEVYTEIDRWVKCYKQLTEHFKGKDFFDQEIKNMVGELPEIDFTPPSTVKKDGLKGFKNFSYKVIPFYRVSYNKKKIKAINEQIEFFAINLKTLKSLAFKVEAYFMDGV